MAMITIAYRIETVVVTDMETITKIYHVCHSFTGDTIDSRAGEADREMFGDQFRYYYIA